MNDQSPLSEAELSKLADIPAIRITMQHQLHDKLVLGFETHVLAQCSRNEFDDRLDKLRQAAERQRAIANLPDTRNQLTNLRINFEAEKEKLLAYQAEAQVLSERWAGAHAASGRRGPFKISPQQQSDRTKLEGQIAGSEQQIRNVLKEIAGYEHKIAQMEKIAGGEEDASDRSPAGL